MCKDRSGSIHQESYKNFVVLFRINPVEIVITITVLENVGS